LLFPAIQRHTFDVFYIDDLRDCAAGDMRAGLVRSLDWQGLRRHDAGVRAPVTKKLGDILYADKSKIRVSEDEWLKVLRAIASGDQGALHSLYEQTHRIVFTLIVRITMNRETAEEVTLDVFYDVWRKASTYDPANGSVVGWVMNQARSRAIDVCGSIRGKKE
jgi:hypothetical protein